MMKSVISQTCARWRALATLLVVLGALMMYQPVLLCHGASVVAGDLRHLYYGEVFLGSLRDGTHRCLLVAVPEEEEVSGRDIVSDEAVRETPVVLIVVVDRCVVSVVVQPERDGAPLPPFRILLSDAETEEGTASRSVLNAVSQHTLADEQRAEFSLHVPLTPIAYDVLFFIRLDTFSRRTLLFESLWWVPPMTAWQLQPAAASPPMRHNESREALPQPRVVTFFEIPRNASFGVHVEGTLRCSNPSCLHSGERCSIELRAIVRRKPPVPPQIVQVELWDSPSEFRSDDPSYQEFQLLKLRQKVADGGIHKSSVVVVGRASSSAPSPSGLPLPPVSFSVSSQGATEAPPRYVLHITTEFEELHRQYHEIFTVDDATMMLKKLRVGHGEQKWLLPDRWHRLSDGTQQTLRVAEHCFLRILLTYDAGQQATSLRLMQPVPLTNVQVHVVDGHNDTIFLEEEHDLPFADAVGERSEPFGWHHGILDTLTWVAGGDRLVIHVYFDVRAPEVGERPDDNYSRPLMDEVSESLTAVAASCSGGESGSLCATRDETSEYETPYFRSWIRALEANDLHFQYRHHAVKERYEFRALLGSFTRWIERHGGRVHADLRVAQAKRRVSPFFIFRAPATANTVVLRVPRALLIAQDMALSVPFIRDVFLGSGRRDWAELARRWQRPLLNDLTRYRGASEEYWSARVEQAVLLALFSLTQAEDVVRGTKFILWQQLIPSLVDRPAQQPLYPLLHHELLAALLEDHGLHYFARVLRQRRALLDDVYDTLEDALPWVFPKSVDRALFLHRVSWVDASSHEGSNADILFLAPGLSFCAHSSTASLDVVYSEAEGELQLRFANIPGVNAAAGGVETPQARSNSTFSYCENRDSRSFLPDGDVDCSHVVTCDWELGYHTGARAYGRLTVLESLLRRGAVSTSAEGVVDVRVDPASCGVGPVREVVSPRVFLLTRAKETVRPLREFLVLLCTLRVEEGTRLSDVHSCATHVLGELLRLRRLELAPGLVARRQKKSTEEDQRPFATEAQFIVSRFLQGAHTVLLFHLEVATQGANSVTASASRRDEEL